MSTSITKLERVNNALKRVRADLKLSGRIGTHALLTASGGVIGGFVEAKFATIPNTTLSTNAVVGVGLVVSALANLFDEYSDEIGATGAGMLAFALGVESAKYFEPTLFQRLTS